MPSKTTANSRWYALWNFAGHNDRRVSVCFVLIILSQARALRGSPLERRRDCRTKTIAQRARQNAKSVNVSLETSAGGIHIAGGSSNFAGCDFNYSDSYETPRVSYKRV